MAADVLDEDRWLYGDTEKQDIRSVQADSNSKLLEIVNENGSDSILDDLDEMEQVVSNDVPLDETAAVEVPGTPPAESAVLEGHKLADMESTPTEEKADVDSDDDDDVQITIGEIKTDIYNRQQTYPRVPATPATPTGIVERKVDLETVPQVNGQSIFEVDLDASEKPWRLPGADITDYFNYGFTEDTWKLYCEKQRKMKTEAGSLYKIAVQSNRVGASIDNSVLTSVTLSNLPHGLPPRSILPLPPVVCTPTVLPHILLANAAMGEQTPESNTMDGDGSDGRRTPNLSTQDSNSGPSLLPLKPPLIPPPLHAMGGGLPPPPFGFPPPGFPGHQGQDHLAAAMAAAAMFGGMRHPDSNNSMPTLPPPPQMPGGPGFPPLHPPGLGPLPDGLHHFHGMPFPPHGDHGHMGFDERGLPPMPPEMLGHGGPFWDPSMGQPPMHNFFPGRSPSHSTSSRSHSRSRSSSYDRQKRRDKKHRRRSRSRSRSVERDRHRSNKHHRDHHRSDRHDRDKDRDKDRDRRSRRDHGRSRQERSSRRHRSTSRDKDEERSSRKEKQKTIEVDNAQDSRSRSRTPS